MSVEAFYDGFARDYDLAYAGRWDAAVERQGAALERLIRAAVPGATSVLDCACGIGTQAIGLALRGFDVHGTDVSSGAVARARHEAERLGAHATFAVADMRDLAPVPGTYDAVIACDNALPHLLEEEDLRRALAAMRAKLRPGGLLVVTLRDFDEALRSRPPVAPTLVVAGPRRQVLVRLHDWDEAAPFYTLRAIVLTEQAGGWTAEEHTTRYRALTRAELERALASAGLESARWHGEDDAVVGAQQLMTARAPGS
jgi:SAM-dependent methyltransferase